MSLSTAFIPGAEAVPSLPLQRFLPPLRSGLTRAWLEANVKPGAAILDPFGASPLLALEAARAGYSVIFAANNPIVRFLLESLAKPATHEEMQAAIASLASIRWGEQRLEPHIRDLYASRCPNCGDQVSARAFIWERDAPAPQAKILDCEHCGDKEEHPIDEADLQRAASYQRAGPHRARALERVATQGDPLRRHVEEALESYLPRAIYGFFTILNRLDRLESNPRQRHLINALLLVALDRCNSIWEHPSGRPRPKQLVNPPLFREHNIWRELEDALSLWASLDLRAPLKEWDGSRPKPGSIALFPGSFRQLSQQFETVAVEALITALPRPNQAYWTLSALWAGWLWGHEAIGPFAGVLKRRRYDWSWHAEALHATLRRVAKRIAKEKPIFGLMGESEEGFLAAAIAAANLADLDLQGIALRQDWAETQLTWSNLPPNRKQSTDASPQIRQAARAFLQANGQPSEYLPLQASALAQLAQGPSLNLAEDDPGELLSAARDEIESIVRQGADLVRYGSESKSVDAGQWWLGSPGQSRGPLADRLEIALVRQLVRKPGQTQAQLDQALCQIFPGLLTPQSSYLGLLLRSYGQQQEGGWQIKHEDQPRARRADLKEMRQLLRALGARFTQVKEGKQSIHWLDESGKARYSFYPIASGIVSEILFSSAPDDAAQRVILLPGSRARLVLTKLEADQRLQDAAQGWLFVKFRHLRRLAQNSALTVDSFAELLNLDPISQDPIQPPLL